MPSSLKSPRLIGPSDAAGYRRVIKFCALQRVTAMNKRKLKEKALRSGVVMGGFPKGSETSPTNSELLDYELRGASPRTFASHPSTRDHTWLRTVSDRV